MIGEIMKTKIICLLIICFLITGCSYVMDSVEGILTNRASFSINAFYVKEDGTLLISWTESLTGESLESFAGYEVYIITKPWDEFGTYELLAAPYNISPQSFFRVVGALGSPYTRTAVIPVLPSDLNGDGEYYVRLGIIKRKKDEDDNYYVMNVENYRIYTSLSRISGYQPVSIY